MSTDDEKIENEINLCSPDAINMLSRKHGKTLLISSKNKEFAKKFASYAAPKDLTVFEVKTGDRCQSVEKMGLADASSAILIEKGKIVSKINLMNDDAKDTTALIKMTENNPEKESYCIAKFRIDKDKWKIEPEQDSQCKRELSKLSKLTLGAQKYFLKHIEPKNLNIEKI